MTNTYKIADRIIEIVSLHNEVHELCRDYLCEGTPDFSVEIHPDDIEYERKRSAAEDEYEGIPVRGFTDSYLETLAVYRKIAEALIEYDTVLFHGSVIAVDGIGYLFTAKSGTGKSTHTRLWRELFGERAVMVNDDKPLLKISEDGVTAYGTPWNGKHRLSSNISVPLRAVCILKRAEENHISQVNTGEAYPMLIQQIYRPKNPVKLKKTLLLADRLAEKAKLYILGCNMDLQAAEIAYNVMKG